MSRPLFWVGEEVILQSVSSPEKNGDAVVLEVLSPEESVARAKELNPDFPGEYRNMEGIGYVLDIPAGMSERGNRLVCWAESALRKKHEGSQDSFEQMMDKLTDKVAA